eukprot:TRINITY_DN890_c0_g1_i1.p1 TRINITY_DN890_c0_g1~~TRINITY_DN890_c0_g1_i1.p1  ORF type:complete len:528 (-),score=117.54 TRINITY_DN890_c0_g1_i1:139-1674(-)
MADDIENANTPAETPQPVEEMKPTPLPLAAMAALSLALFANSLSTTILYPFAPVMVAQFKVTDDPAKIGYFAGFLASAFFIGNVISQPFWGSLCDTFGRRPVLLTGLSCNALFGMIFGFSINFPWAVLSRLLQGLLASTFVAGRTCIFELTDDSNAALGLSFMGLSYALGLMFGPSVGGLLAQPALKYPSLFPPGSLFDKFIVLLPCIVLTIMSLIGLTLSYFFVPETKGRALSRKDAMAKKAAEEAARKAANPDSLTEPLLLQGENEGGKEKPSSSSAGTVVEEDDPGVWGAIFNERDVLVTTMLMCFTAYMCTGWDELFPLWSLTDWSLGGLSFTTSNVGLAQAAGGLGLIPIQLLLRPWVCKKFGVIMALQLALSTGILQALVPALRLIGPGHPVTMQIVTTFVFLARSWNESAIGTMFMLTANAVRHPKYMGAVNGFVGTCQSVSAGIAPFSMGSLYAWSTSRRGSFPLDFHLAWIVLGLLHLVALPITLLLPESMKRRKFVTKRGH